MSQVLYRKYRAQAFTEMIGQEQIMRVLEATVKKKAPAHAYLFTGPRGTGKTSTARIFAREINGIAAGEDLSKYPDIIEVDAASNRGINEIRELKEKIAFAPAQLNYKVYIIDEVHMLTTEAFNAILKTLEEPPSHVIFLMATTEAHKLPVTIISRVVRFDFQLATAQQLRAKLEKIIAAEGIKAEAEALDLVVKAARGSFRDSESLLEKVISVSEDKEITASEVEKILGLSSSDALAEIYQSVVTSAISVEAAAKTIEAAFLAGINPQQFLADFSNLVLEKIMGESAPKSLLYKLIGQLQTLQINFANFLDPQTTIKLALLALKLEGEGTVQVVAANKSASFRPAKPLQPKAEKLKTEKPIATPQRVPEQFTETGELAPVLISELGKADRRLAMIVQQGKLVKNEQGLLLKLPYKFHVDQLSKPTNKKLLHQALTAISDYEQISVELDSSITPQVKANVHQAVAGNDKLVEEVFADLITTN